MNILTYDGFKTTLKEQFPKLLNAFDPVKDSVVELYSNLLPKSTEGLSDSEQTTIKSQDIVFKLLPFVATYFATSPAICAGLTLTIVFNLTKADLVTNQIVKDIFCGVGGALFLIALVPLAKVITFVVIGSALIKIGCRYENTKVIKYPVVTTDSPIPSSES